jgi:hypothetical protein
LEKGSLLYTYSASSLTWAAPATFGEAVDADGCTGDDVVEMTGAGDKEAFVVVRVFSEVEVSFVDVFGVAAVGTLVLVFSEAIVAFAVAAVAAVALFVEGVFTLAGVVAFVVVALLVALLALLAAAP